MTARPVGAGAAVVVAQAAAEAVFCAKVFLHEVFEGSWRDAANPTKVKHQRHRKAGAAEQDCPMGFPRDVDEGLPRVVSALHFDHCLQVALCSSHLQALSA